MKDLQNLIHIFADERMKEHNRSTRKIYVRFLLDFNLFQNNWAGAKGWEHLQKESLILAWLRQQGKSVNTKSLGLCLRLLRDFLESLKGRDLIAENVVEQLYRR